MIKRIVFITLVLTSATCRAQNLQDRLTVNDAKIDAIIAGMSLEEKVEMLHSKTIMSSAGNERRGIADMKYADGPFGIREEVGNFFRPLGWTTDSATYFPTGSALAATWSESLAYDYGQGMGREARRRGKDVILGPAINIQRLPVGGRSYEYLSEDPILSGALGAAYIQGSQDAGTAVSVKHYAVNNQEANRGTVNAVVDERTLREIYLRPFQDAVIKGGAMCVMTAYNKVNGYYCSENVHLNNEILRGEWGFKGFTVSDWGGTHSTMGAALGGLDVQMTGDNYLGKPLIDSVRSGAISEAVVDAKVKNILRVRFAIRAVPESEANKEPTSQAAEQQIAYRVAQKSIVLLKNERRILPLKASDLRRIAVVGKMAQVKTALGGVGAGVKTPYEITPLQGIINEVGERKVTYYEGYDPALKKADVIIFVAGNTREDESESRDRKDIFLPHQQDSLLNLVAQTNVPIVTVVISGGPCDLRQAVVASKALVQGWWNGMEGGHALADVLFGKISPSGKLPFTLPQKLEDSPAYALGNYPQTEADGDIFATQYRKDIEGGKRKVEGGKNGPTARYTEGPLVGYRWFDTKQQDVLYPFGYGLSYTRFSYHNLKTSKSSYGPDDTIDVTFTLSNSGTFDADEVAQLYVRRVDAKVEWPMQELKAFRRVSVKSGDDRQVTLSFPVSDLRYYDVQTNQYQLEPGTIEIAIGSSSREANLTERVVISQ